MTEQSPMHEEAPGKEGSMTRCACCFAPSESEFCSVWCREAFVPERVYHLKREEAVSAERLRIDAAIGCARAKRVCRRRMLCLRVQCSKRIREQRIWQRAFALRSRTRRLRGVLRDADDRCDCGAPAGSCYGHDGRSSVVGVCQW